MKSETGAPIHAKNTACPHEPGGGPYIPRRDIHLDFHTGPAVPDVAADFDSGAFAQTFVDARVDSVAVFAKCHHGHLYFETVHPARHPGLPDGLNLLGEQVDALHSVGIRAPIYLSVQCDEYAADTHPEWLAVEADGRLVKRIAGQQVDTLTPGWQILDMSSPYQDYLADQLDLVLRRFAPVDGIYFDMCWDQPSVSHWAQEGMRRRGLDPGGSREVRPRDEPRLHGALPGHDPEYSSQFATGERLLQLPAVRSRGRGTGVREPCGDRGAPDRRLGLRPHPYVARLVRAAGLPAYGQTGRFHKSWGDNAGSSPPRHCVTSAAYC